jgi:hypothetical protein
VDFWVKFTATAFLFLIIMAITADPPSDVPFTRLENACKIGNSRVITLDAARIHTSIKIPMKIANNKCGISGERGLF